MLCITFGCNRLNEVSDFALFREKKLQILALRIDLLPLPSLLLLSGAECFISWVLAVSSQSPTVNFY